MKRPGGLDREAIDADQLQKLRRLIDALVPCNRFYTTKLTEVGLDRELPSLAQFTARMPFTVKDELLADQHDEPPYGSNLTYPLERYTRFNQTSATADRPLRWLDTPESWDWMLDNWARVFAAAGVRPGDRMFFAFSFGPFLGFWTAFEAALRQQVLCIPGGGMSSAARLQAILDNHATILCCTPTYAIRLGQVAAEQNIDLGSAQVHRIIVAGEPGGSVPATRAAIERFWPKGRVFDQHGMTEVGPVTFQNPHHPDILHVMETAYLAEVIDPATRQAVDRGQTGELVLTTLGRTGSPLLRYRTADLVRQSLRGPDELGTAEMALQGGILGRNDEMVLVRGVNIYPSAVDQVVRSLEGIAEYRVEVNASGAMTELKLLIEPQPAQDGDALCARLQEAMRGTFHLRVPVSAVPTGHLPRFEMKARRWVTRT